MMSKEAEICIIIHVHLGRFLIFVGGGGGGGEGGSASGGGKRGPRSRILGQGGQTFCWL